MTAAPDDTPDPCLVCNTRPAVEFKLCAPCLAAAFWLTDLPIHD